MSRDKPRWMKVSKQDQVAVVTYSNPPQGLISANGAMQLDETLTLLVGDPEVRSIVLSGGQAGVFIRHADVGQIAWAGEALAEQRTQPADWLQSPFRALCRTIAMSPKPIIAAIDGVCFGGGLEIALPCAMRIASPDSSLGLPEIRLGIFPGSGGTQRLARLIGSHLARLWILRGEIVSADQARRVGLIDEIASAPLDRAISVAAELATRPPAAVAAVMALTREPMEDPRLDEEVLRFAELLRDHPEVRNRLRAFVDGMEQLHELP